MAQAHYPSRPVLSCGGFMPDAASNGGLGGRGVRERTALGVDAARQQVERVGDVLAREALGGLLVAGLDRVEDALVL